MKIVVARKIKKNIIERLYSMRDCDACATVGIAYYRAAGVYTMDAREMQELELRLFTFTIATSYMRAHNE